MTVHLLIPVGWYHHHLILSHFACFYLPCSTFTSPAAYFVASASICLCIPACYAATYATCCCASTCCTCRRRAGWKVTFCCYVPPSKATSWRRSLPLFADYKLAPPKLPSPVVAFVPIDLKNESKGSGCTIPGPAMPKSTMFCGYAPSPRSVAASTDFLFLPPPLPPLT